MNKRAFRSPAAAYWPAILEETPNHLRRHDTFMAQGEMRVKYFGTRAGEPQEFIFAAPEDVLLLVVQCPGAGAR